MNKFNALVPMKAHSERVKNKNMREMAGSPLFYYVLRTLGKCKHISSIYVDTDSDAIKELIRKDFKNVKLIDRPENLIGDSVSMNRIIEHDMSRIDGDYFFQTHSTNPLLKAETIDRAMEFFLSNDEYDSLFSVTKSLKRYYDSDARPVNHDAKALLNTQDLKPLYEENSCIYLFTRNSFAINKHRIGQKPYMFEMKSKEEAMDIDDEADFRLVEKLMLAGKNL